MKKVHAWFERFLSSSNHYLLLSIYFVFRLFAFNVYDVPLLHLLRPLLVSVLAAVLLFQLFHFAVRDRHLAALMTSALLVMFYLYAVGWSLFPFDGTYSNALFFALFWLLLTTLMLFGIAKIKNAINQEFIAGVNVMVLILLLFPSIQYLRYLIGENLPSEPTVHQVFNGNAISAPPDVYYIILDAYSRADYLEDKFGYDNSDFLQSLRTLGFYVADCSQSNYVSTHLSLSSALNLDYIQNLSEDFDPEHTGVADLSDLLADNLVRDAFSEMGYQTVSFASGFPWAEWRDADIYMAPPYGPMTEFETVLLHSSYANVLDHLNIINYDDLYAETFRVRTHLVLDSVDELAGIQGPKFVFVHLIIPHTPYGFDENGNPVAPDRGGAQAGYLSQVKFINKAILPWLETLIKTSDVPPIILLQGDHGSRLSDGSTDQVKNLSAYYLPNGSEALYPTITPVNSFRIVFNTYFGTDFPLLEDVSYFSSSKQKGFSVVEQSCP